MKVKIRFFASYRERVGASQTELELSEVKTISDLLQMVRRDFPELPDAPILVAINAEFVAPSYELHEGDEVALMPPVSGG